VFRRIAQIGLFLAAALVHVGAANAASSGEAGRIVFQRPSGGDYDIFVVNSDGTGSRNLTPASEVDDHSPSVSPDGARIAYTRDMSRLVGHIFVKSIDGSGRRDLTRNSTASNVAPSFSPNGRKIIFGRPIEHFVSHIFVMSIDGSARRNLTRDSTAENYGFSFSPNGRKIVFTSSRGRGDSNIWVMDRDGRHKRNLTAGNQQSDGEAEFSPDGRSIAYSAWFDDDPDIVLMSANGTDKRFLTFGGDFEESPTFSTDGGTIAFDSGYPIDDVDYDILAMDADGGNVRNLTPDRPNDDLNGSFSPDGGKIVFGDGSGNLFVMDADGSNVLALGLGSAPVWTPN
jgi:TolB protein